MDIVKFQGRMGNQMFQYAFMEMLREQGREVYADLSWFSKDKRPIRIERVFPGVKLIDWEIKYADDAIIYHHVKKKYEQMVSHYDSSTLKLENCFFDGYWESDKYFYPIREKIRRQFVFDIHDLGMDKVLEYIGEYTGVQVRRTDYLGTDFDVCTKEYYDKAINYILEIDKNSKFIFFSDDKKWVEENFNKDNMIICDGEMFDSYVDSYDMYLMTQCKNVIISNSTFGWWGAWLNDKANKIVISPSIYDKENSILDIYCEDWIKIDV